MTERTAAAGSQHEEALHGLAKIADQRPIEARGLPSPLRTS
jgi:hypothetical protein